MCIYSLHYHYLYGVDWVDDGLGKWGKEGGCDLLAIWTYGLCGWFIGVALNDEDVPVERLEITLELAPMSSPVFLLSLLLNPLWQVSQHSSSIIWLSITLWDDGEYRKCSKWGVGVSFKNVRVLLCGEVIKIFGLIDGSGLFISRFCGRWYALSPKSLVFSVGSVESSFLICFLFISIKSWFSWPGDLVRTLYNQFTITIKI